MRGKKVKPLPPSGRKIIFRRTPASKLAYTPEFGKFMEKNRWLLRAFVEARKEKWSAGAVRKIGEARITRLEGRGAFHEDLWMVSAGGRSMFVKEIGAGYANWEKIMQGLYEDFYRRDIKNATQGGNRGFLGAEQFMASRKLERLKGKLFPHIEIAEYHLGWTSGKASYLVTKFYSARRLGESRPHEISGSLLKEFMQFQEFAEKAGFFDINARNAFYDFARKKIIVFDVWDISKREKPARGA